MAAIRADFACLALNFTLCSVFTGRFFSGDLAPKTSGSNDPSGFVLPNSLQRCSADQWASAVNVLGPSLASQVWSQSICPAEVDLLQTVPPRGKARINGTVIRRHTRPACAPPLIRKGSKLYALSGQPKDCPRVSPCSRPGTLEVCHRLREYAPGEAPNPFGEEASFVLSPDSKKAKKVPSTAREASSHGSKGAAASTVKPRRDSAVRKTKPPEEGALKAASKEKFVPRTAEPARQKKKPVDADREDDDNEEQETTKMWRQLSNSDPRTIINLAVAKINAKDYKTSIELYSLLGVGPFMKEKLVGRGTAYLLSGKKDKALEDFNEAVELFPSDADIFRRRASVFDNMGRKDEAFEDLSRSIELDPDNEEARHLRGALAFNAQDFWTAIEDFNVSALKRPTDPVVLNAVGLALMGAGRYQDAADAYKVAVRNVPHSATLWSEKGRAHKELAQVELAEEALRRALQLDEGTVMFHRLASLKHLTGYHQETIRVAERGLEANPTDIELNFLAAASKHARGDFIEAIKHYDRVMSLDAGQNSGMLTQQFLSFYLREICAYTLTKSDLPLDEFHLDDDMTPEFKVHWVKKMNPMELFPGYKTVQLTPEVVRRGPVGLAILPRDAFKLIRAADRIGGHAQYFVHGFMPNRRQYRMAGLAALDLMDRARSTWAAASRKLEEISGDEDEEAEEEEERKFKIKQVVKGLADDLFDDEDDDDEEDTEAQPTPNGWSSRSGKGKRKGKGKAPSASSSWSGGPGGSGSGKGATLIKNWRGLFNNLVRWRQLSEPADTIAWIDGLGKEYIAGFGSITAMTVGQMENLKYYPEYKRGFELMKQRLYDSEEAMNATGAAMYISRAKKGKKILAAKTRKALWEVVGENFFVTTQCYSFSKPGLIMNGTQLTLVESLKSHDFAIRTPVTPERMRDFGIEMQVAWEDLTALMLDKRLKKENPELHSQEVKDCIMRVGYYWFQLMPLARGSAMVGLISMHGLSLASGMEIIEYIPTGLQIDWESILAPKFENFKEAIGHWFFKNTKPADWNLPKVMRTLPTVRHVIAAMSYEEE